MLYFENDYCEGAHPAILPKQRAALPAAARMQT